jgi:hypothetical protein
MAPWPWGSRLVFYDLCGMLLRLSYLVPLAIGVSLAIVHLRRLIVTVYGRITASQPQRCPFTIDFLVSFYFLSLETNHGLCRTMFVT